MENNKFTVSQKITGMERKTIIAIVGEQLGERVKYLGVPSYAYMVGGWTIDKNGVLKSPEIEFSEMANIKAVIAKLNIAGLAAEGKVQIGIGAEGYSEIAVANIGNLIKSKESLIKKALGVDGGIEPTSNNEKITLAFWNATLRADELLAYITFAWKLSEQARTLKHASPKEKAVSNEKYAFRCFLLRLGFIGDEFKEARKVLLGRLEGNGAFKTKTSISDPSQETETADRSSIATDMKEAV